MLSCGLILLGLGLFLYKAVFLDLPLTPQAKSSIWNAEVHVTFTALNRPVKVSFFIPQNTRRFVFLNENFVSRSYGLTTAVKKGNRMATWSIRKAGGKQDLYYTVSVRVAEGGDVPASFTPPEIEASGFEGAYLAAADSIVAEVREKSADVNDLVAQLFQHLNKSPPDDTVALLLGERASMMEKVDLAARLLAHAAIPARAVHGISLAEQMRAAPLVHWLEVFQDRKWESYDLATDGAGIQENYLPWWRGKDSLARVEGGRDLHAEFSVNASPKGAMEALIGREGARRSLPMEYSLFTLPLQNQAVYRVLLLVPVGAFFLVILRNVVGINTFGTFMPVLIALAFRETQLLWGLIMFTLMVALGLGIRRYLEHLKLLMVPRLASVLIVVILLMAALSILTHKLGLERGVSVALFPMVILTMTIERMSIAWEEQGPVEALRRGFGSLVAATLTYLLMTVKHIEHLVFVFPELLLLVLAGSLLLGRYSGYRLTELRRFKALAEEKV